MELALNGQQQNVLEQYQSTIQQILSSYEQEFLNSPGLSAFRALSAVPPHPYEQMKYRLLGENYKDYKPKSINDIEYTGPIDKQACKEVLKKCTENVYLNINHNLTACDDNKLETVFHVISNGCPAWDKDKNLQLLEFTEMVKNIPISSINSNTAYIYANKLVSEFVKVFNLNQVS